MVDPHGHVLDRPMLPAIKICSILSSSNDSISDRSFGLALSENRQVMAVQSLAATAVGQLVDESKCLPTNSSFNLLLPLRFMHQRWSSAGT